MTNEPCPSIATAPMAEGLRRTEVEGEPIPVRALPEMVFFDVQPNFKVRISGRDT